MAVNKRAAALAAAKQKKQKMIAIGGFVVLLAVLAFSVPKTLKMLKGPQPVEPVATEASPTPAPVTPGAATPAPTPTPTPSAGAAELIDTGSLPEPTEGQFISFERFASKDPFAQQVSGTAEAAAPEASEAPVEIPVPELPEQEPAAPSSPSAPAEPETPSTPEDAPAPASKPTSAVLTVNGVRETVEVGAEFPKDEQIFELVALTPTSAKIGIAGGSLTGGAATVTLEKGKKVTLMNTADGTQYELVLVSLG